MDFCALQIQEMASFLRNCWPCPLADSIDYVFRWKLGDKLALQLYQAFLREPAERNLYADRYHIFFPWMIEVIDDKKNRGRNEWVAVLVKLIELDLNKLLPNFMRGKLHSEIGNLFNYACKNRNFDVAEKVWDYCKITGLSHRFSVNSLFLFTLYHWMNGRKMKAKTIASVLQSRIRFLRDVSNNKFSEDKVMEEMKEWKNIRDRFLEINRSYKDIMENPQTKERTRKVCNRVLNEFVNDFIDNKNRK
uniref:Uncharacterized protein n=1 Tax=Meloidogyne enterolobii TaxID=390850 RepID=A0A6V7XG43_MELEN|nr:unnamed protein product [Meloidogyne enterolobii]